MQIASIEAWPVSIPRDRNAATGTAGSPTSLSGNEGRYRWSSTFPCLYPVNLETALIRVRLDDGSEGWGEAQAPVAPEVACAIAEHVLAAAVQNQPFEPTRERIAELYSLMYASMRVRGQTGGFMLDAMAGVDIALWDLAGQLLGKPLHELLRPEAPGRVPYYLSGLPGGDWNSAQRWFDHGCDHVKVFHSTEQSDVLKLIDTCPSNVQVAVDALWRLEPASARAFAEELGKRGIWFLECPFYPELIQEHRELRRSVSIPLALGESYRTTFELAPFAGIVNIVQPDLGRCGITGSLRIAEWAEAQNALVIPHVSLAMGPQIAAAIHFAAAAGCPYLEFNPSVVETANQYLRAPLAVRGGAWHVPEDRGLGIQLLEVDHQPR